MSQFVVNIECGALVEGSRFVPADKIAAMYKTAVEAEIHETVRATVFLRVHPGAPTEGKRAYVEVKLSSAARRQEFGAITNRGMSYMFELRDAVQAVIDGFVPPEEAWVSETPQVMIGALPMDAPKLDVNEHHMEIAAAMHKISYPDAGAGGEVGSTYINDAKAFIAAFNAAMDIFSRISALRASGPPSEQATQSTEPQPQTVTAEGPTQG